MEINQNIKQNPMNQEHFDNLLAVASTLDKVPMASFDFANIFGTSVKKPSDKFDCGTAGCAIGWTPLALPHIAKWHKHTRNSNWDVYINDINVRGAVSIADCGAFGLSIDEAKGLFYPTYQDLIDEPCLGVDASPSEVADLIRRFVARKQRMG
jgi:hypothetical protein